ncbi:rRNA biogenesis protein RRP36 [Tuber brumale]|nr:rRNA biogenesis protein RRP36 [Tuber brumale]
MSFRRIKPFVDDDDNDHYGQENVMNDSVGSRGGSEAEISGSNDEDMTWGGNESEDSDDDMDMEGGGSDEEERPNAQDAISHISFGTLAKAQKSIARERQKSQSLSKTDWAAATKAQLAALKESQGIKPPKPRKTREELKRSSKHAPQEISSKRAVTRRREAIAPIIPVAQAARDPRFDTAVKGVYDEKVFKKNYSFLDDYREDEMKALKQEIFKSKDEQKKERLKKELLSMESRRRTEKNKEQGEKVVREHRKRERELIKQGKKPFYLKKAEQKKLLLIEKYSKLNEKQLEKVMEKKRKRKSQKERKSMPFLRRVG